MKIPATFAILAVLVGCAPPRETASVTSDGGSVSVARNIGAGTTEEFVVTSAEGWSCRGSIKHPMAGFTKEEFTFPMTCTNGVTGTGKVTYGSNIRTYQLANTAEVQFQLSNGVTGSVKV